MRRKQVYLLALFAMVVALLATLPLRARAALRQARMKVNLSKKFASFTEHWRPKIIATVNGQDVKLVKFKGEFVWHRHEDADEMFLAWRGRFRLEFRDRSIDLEEGELYVVPRGAEHRTVADEEAEALIVEPLYTRNTGNVTDPHFTARAEKI